MSHAKGTYTGTGTLYARGVSLEDFLSSDIELLLEYFFSQSGTPSPLSHPQKSPRARYARVRRFPIFVFTASPFRHKPLMINVLRVKASPAKPSHKVHRFLHRNLLCTN